MSGNIAGFDANQVDPNESNIIPAGEYDAVIIASELKPTKDGQGKYLKLQLQILSGQYQNRQLFDNLNLQSHGPNKETTETIARGKLSGICRAVNVLTPNDSSELHNKPLKITVKVRDGGDEYGKQNNVTAYKPRNAGPASVDTQQAVAAGQTNNKPW